MGVRVASALSGAAPPLLSPGSGIRSAVAARASACQYIRMAHNRGWSPLGASLSQTTSEARHAEAAVQVASARIGAASRRGRHSSGTRSAAVVAATLPEELVA